MLEFQESEGKKMSPTPQTFDIDAMIAGEPDPKLRVLLLLFKAFNQNLAANTLAIQSLGKKFDEHLTTFESRAAQDDALKNQGRGIYRVAAYIIAAVQVAGMGIWVQAREDIKEIHSAIADGKTAVTRLEERLKSLEAKK